MGHTCPDLLWVLPFLNLWVVSEYVPYALISEF